MNWEEDNATVFPAVRMEGSAPLAVSGSSDNDWSEEEDPAPKKAFGRGRGGGSMMSRCYKCEKEGHTVADCPNGDDQFKVKISRCVSGWGGIGGPPCFSCKDEERMKMQNGEGVSVGHGENGAEDTGLFSGCRVCGEKGHFARTCPKNPAPTACYNCGEEGHFSKDCNNARKEDAARPPGTDGKPAAVKYEPPELLVGEAIFQERSQVFEGTGINFAKYESIQHSISGASPVPSVESFHQLQLRPLILDNLKKCGYANPTPIQKHGSPQLMFGRDVMCCAQTGSGKTAAYLLPIVNRLMGQQELLSSAGQKPVKPEALILAPTRELAIQIANEANMYANGSVIKTQVVYGQTSYIQMKIRLTSRGCNILVATVGRLKQCLTDKIVDLSNVQHFILDEADRMLDMGFLGEIKSIVEMLPPKDQRVSGMFSATFPNEIQVAASEFLHDYVFVVIGVIGGAYNDVKQEVVEVDLADKRDTLMNILTEEGRKTKVLIFCETRDGADQLAVALAARDISVTSIHGARYQCQREQALMEFKTGKRQVLVATSVAARGLDIPKVGLVINYDLPSEIDVYVHRIGRTGRVGHPGRAISFYDAGRDSSLRPGLRAILEGAGQIVPEFIQEGDGDGGDSDGNSSFAFGDFACVDQRNIVAATANQDSDDDDDGWD